MKASELRIGNWLYSNLSLKEFQVNAGDIESISGDQNCCKPIKLTEEWLVKFGFQLRDKVNKGFTIKFNWDHNEEFIYCSKNGVVALYNEKLNQDFIFKQNCDYVHQLQNLYFALTGLELENN